MIIGEAGIGKTALAEALAAEAEQDGATVLRPDRVSFEVASASSFSGTGYDLAATFDCLQMATDAGFTRFRRAAETPFNLVYEVRP